MKQIRFWSDLSTERNNRNLSWTMVERESGVRNLAKRWASRTPLSSDEAQKLADWAGYDLTQYEEALA